ncbi:MAG: biotin synthase BioB [Rikenellaceae bacterium]
MILKLRDRVLSGGSITYDEALALAQSEESEALYTAAQQVTEHFHTQSFDLCSIINAKSGRCSENCKWCAQSAHFKTSVEEYPLLGSEECVKWAKHNHAQGVGRYSLVMSGKRLTPAELEVVAQIYRDIAAESTIKLCASMGLLGLEELRTLKEAGVNRYHCNLETAPSFFDSLCSTHTQQQKIETIRHAQSLGMDICSGGIIGMGESMAQRVELAFALRELGVDSIPLNVLQPIAGTPLENSTPLSAEEILTTVALFRFINPRAWLRFAGGRAQMSRETTKRAMKIGVNSAIVGDMLTTVGSKIKDDKELIAEVGYSL